MSKFKIGIEYELEGLMGDAEFYQNEGLVPLGWNATYDGTLRGASAEFVSTPVCISKAHDRVESLLDMIGDDYDNSHRTSMHIHISVDDLNTWQQYVLYSLLVANEDKFFSYDPDRKLNHYCTPVLRTPVFYQGISLLSNGFIWKNGQTAEQASGFAMNTLYGANCKYSSVNVMPCSRGGIGTIELRHFAPIMDMVDVDDVLNVIQEARNTAAQNIESFDDMISLLSDLGSENADIQWCHRAIAQLVEENPRYLLSKKSKRKPAPVSPDMEAELNRRRRAILDATDESSLYAGDIFSNMNSGE